ncbi:hypothetical protein [Marinomonas gallaica]|uniref:hypothetical protein n=1 Tax=Marinomonas gallaica TaxID=1806667 RepID=UPI003A912A74
MKQYKYTVLGAILAGVVFLLTVLLDVELFEKLIFWLNELEHLEIDELIIPALIFMVFFVIDLVRRSKTNQLNSEKLKIYRAMVASTHHVLNNLLNQMLFVKMKAEDTPGFDPKVLKIYDTIVDDAKSQIEALSNVTEVNEDSITDSVRPK